MDHEICNYVEETSNEIGLHKNIVAFVRYSPNVMELTRKYHCGDRHCGRAAFQLHLAMFDMH